MSTKSLTSPSIEQVCQWGNESPMFSQESWDYELFFAQKAAQWAADQELEACIEWLREYHQGKCAGGTENLRRSRRPKPRNLKELAIEHLADAHNADKIDDTTFEIIRRALERPNA